MRESNSIAPSIYHICLYAFKYVPVLGTILLTVHCALLFHHIHVPFLAIVCGNSLFGTIALTSASYAFKFCTLHRLFILYNFAVTFCINYQVVVGFGFMRHWLHLMTTLVGITLLIILIKRRGLCHSRML